MEEVLKNSQLCELLCFPQNCNAQLDHEREAHAATKQENEHMRKQRVIQLQEYQKLVDIRTALETEMSAYRKLIAAEETRLVFYFQDSMRC